MSRKHHLAELQMAIMQVLWDRGEATVAEVRESLAPRCVQPQGRSSCRIPKS